MNNSVPFRGTSGPHKKHHPFKKGLPFASLEGRVRVSPFMGIKQAESLRKQSRKWPNIPLRSDKPKAWASWRFISRDQKRAVPFHSPKEKMLAPQGPSPPRVWGSPKVLLLEGTQVAWSSRLRRPRGTGPRDSATLQIGWTGMHAFWSNPGPSPHQSVGSCPGPPLCHAGSQSE